MANFYLYVDESGKLNSKSEYTSFCGFISHQSEWWRFSQEWDNHRHAWGCPPIHMALIGHPEWDKSGQWQAYKTKLGTTWDIRREQILVDFSDLIRLSTLVCVGTVVDADHYRAMPDSDYKREMKDPLFLAFYNVVRNALDTIDTVHPNRTDALAVIVDDDQQNSLDCYTLLNQMRSQFPDAIGKRVDMMAFGNDKAYAGLQAADMIAYEARVRMIAKKQDPKSGPTRLYAAMTRDGLHQPTLYTPEFLDILNSGANVQP